MEENNDRPNLVPSWREDFAVIRPVDVSRMDMTRRKELDSQSAKSSAKSESLLQAFSAALAAAQEFEGATAPNPPVGCVILSRDGRVLAVAAHQKAGAHHAEALAIDMCRRNGTLANIHTLIVTLEPCNHHGRTPPCTGAILSTPAREIWIGVADPNGNVKGGGAETLRAAGLAVHFWSELPNGVEASRRAERLIAPFAKRVTTGLPWITVKQAINRDGGMIPTPGAKTFTTPSSLDLAHQLRKRADAILTGSGTVLADAPLLNVRRLPDFPAKRRTLVLMDRRNRIPKDYIEEAMARGFDVLRPASLAEAFNALGKAGANEVLVEAGPELTNAILSSGKWDEHVLIKQGAASDLPDTVTITTNPKSESDHVLRNH